MNALVGDLLDFARSRLGRDKIFNPLHRIEGDKPVAPRENLGLGLYITERIVAAHGGTIGVESSDEHGTTFTIRLPNRVRTRHAT